jgi:hypothetical protein
MTVLARFDTPAALRDVRSAAKRERWSRRLTNAFGPLARDFRQFYDPTQVSTPGDAEVVPVVWAASPAKLRRVSSDPVERWRIADSSRDQQDEYCEWAVEKAGGKITRVTFTTEVPEYFDFLAHRAPDRLLALYEQLAGVKVALKDLVSGGEYRPRNRGNAESPARGRLVHLSQENNTLGAALALVAVATVQRERNGVPVTTKQDLAQCSGLGDAFRNSDPQIAAIVNAAAGTGASITLKDPLGLYIDRLVTTGMVTPDGADPATFWKIERGGREHAVRASFAVPPGRGYTVGDVKIGDRPIRFGAQLADRVQIRIDAVVKPGNARPRRKPCRG